MWNTSNGTTLFRATLNRMKRKQLTYSDSNVTYCYLPGFWGEVWV